MLQFATSAPEFIVRELLAFVPGVTMRPAEVGEAPNTVDTIITASRPSDALEMGIVALVSEGWSLNPWRPREHTLGTPLVSNPTFAMAAASIERGGSSSAPAAAFAR